MNIGLLVVLVCVNSVLGVPEYGCVDEDTFKTENSELFSNIIRMVSSRSLYERFDRLSIYLGKRAFSTLKTMVIDGKTIVLKIISLIWRDDRIMAKNDVEHIKIASGIDPNTVQTKLSSDMIKDNKFYKFCIEFEKGVIIFMKNGHYSLDNPKALEYFKGLSPINQIVVILKMIYSVYLLHQKEIIHSDVRPANFFSMDADFKEFQLIDYGFAGRNTENFKGGNPYYLAPEYVKIYSSSVLSPQLDIYSLGITIMLLLEGFYAEYDNIDNACFSIELTESCHKEILDVVRDTFQRNLNLFPLKKVIEGALSFEESSRYDSVETFLLKVVEIAPEIPGGKEYLQKLIESDESMAEMKDLVTKGLSNSKNPEVNSSQNSQQKDINVVNGSKNSSKGQTNLTKQPQEQKQKNIFNPHDSEDCDLENGMNDEDGAQVTDNKCFKLKNFIDMHNARVIAYYPEKKTEENNEKQILEKKKKKNEIQDDQVLTYEIPSSKQFLYNKNIFYKKLIFPESFEDQNPKIDGKLPGKALNILI